MNSIHQLSLFDHLHDFDRSDQLQRLEAILSLFDEASFLETLRRRRGHGRNDYSTHYLWRVFLSFFFLEHDVMVSLLREINRNTELRWLLGGAMTSRAPSESAMSRFLKNLQDFLPELRELFIRQREELARWLPDFGKHTAIDSKILASRALTSTDRQRDGRRDVDATWGVKRYYGIGEDGREWESVKKTFGYKLHLLVDSTWELPLDYQVTPASHSDLSVGEDMLERILCEESVVWEKLETLRGDKGYDSEPFARRLVEAGVIPLIDIRKMWGDEPQRLFDARRSQLYLQEDGSLVCYCPTTGTRRTLINDGFEKGRMSQRKKCPALAYGQVCAGRDLCEIPSVLRIPVLSNPRRFPPYARDSYKWKRLYRERTAVERVNSRLDSGLGLGDKKVRSSKKQELFVVGGLLIMMGQAVVAARRFHEQEEKIEAKGLRSLRRAG